MTENKKLLRGLQVLSLFVFAAVGALAQSDHPSGQLALAGDAGKTAVDQRTAIKSATPDDSYVIGADDVLAVSVWKEPEVSRSVPVRSDGKISLSLIGELQAAGQTPRQLEQDIAKRLQSYISEPEVTVIVQDARSQRINILGMVAKPGSYLLTGSTTALDAIALAGGFKDFAKQKSIYVLRANADGTQNRIPFNYKEVIKGKNPEQNIRLLPRDTVVIP
jgi:polysaccharide export outer membrane protein